MASKAQIKAVTKYNKEKTTTICLRLNNSTDKDILEHLRQFSNKTGYIKDLIRADILLDN